MKFQCRATSVRMLVAIIVTMLMFNTGAACKSDPDCDTIIVGEIDTDQDAQEWGQ